VAEVRPFRGLRYNPKLAPDLAKVLCPPYDVISPQLQEALYQRSPYNIVRLEYGKEPPEEAPGLDRYTTAARLLERWRQQEVLVVDQVPAFYLVRQRFTDILGHPRERHVLFGRVRLEEFSKGIVLPHEETAEGPKRDRLALLSACRANLSPIMGLYRDGTGRIAQTCQETQRQPPLYQAIDDEGEELTLWSISQAAGTEAIERALAPVPIYLADGHHRYETALFYRDSQRGQGHAAEDTGYAMMGLMDLADPGLQVQGYHRVLGGLDDAAEARLTNYLETAFEMVATTDLPDESRAASLRVKALLTGRPSSRRAIGLADRQGSRFRLLALRQEAHARLRQRSPSAPELVECDPWVIQEAVLNPLLSSSPQGSAPIVEYVHDDEDALQRLHTGSAQAALLLAPLPLDLFEKVVKRGIRLPPKSTYFTPKLPTGLVIYAFGV
jgi:uncharacterized protein (DUF1015 family)